MRTATSPRRAFTLLEVLLAMTIFGLIAVGVLGTFRTATASYERSSEMMTNLQAGRAASDVLARDLRSVFLVNETNYGALLPEGEQDSATGVNTGLDDARRRRAEELEEAGIIDYSLTQLDDLINEEDFDDPTQVAELDFRLEDGGELDTVSLVRRRHAIDARRAQPWGLVRTVYAVKDGTLTRATSPVFREEVPLILLPDETMDQARRRQEEMTTQPDELEEEVAAGVEIFDVRAVHWSNEAWVYAPTWDSEAREARNSLGHLEIAIDDPNRTVYDNLVNSFAYDGLPSALEITLGLRPDPEGSLIMSRHLVPIYAGQETWAPADPLLLEALEDSAINTARRTSSRSTSNTSSRRRTR